MIYCIIILILITSIILYDVMGLVDKKNIVYISVVFILCAISAFSFRLGSDVINYMYEFDHDTCTVSQLSWNYLLETPARQPGWLLFASIIKTIYPSFTFLKITHSFILNMTFGYFIIQNIQKRFSALLLYFISIYFSLNFEVLREALAVSAFLLSVKYFMTQKWFLYYVFVTIAISLHSSAIPLLFLPVINLISNKKKGILGILIICIITLLSSNLIQSSFANLMFIDSLTDQTTYYLGSDSYGSSIVSLSNIINYILNIVMPIYVLMQTFGKSKISQYSIFICAYALIYAISLQLPIFYRFNNYYNIFYIFVYIAFFESGFCIKKIEIRLKKILFIIGMLSFCILKAAIMLIPIDNIPNYVRYYPYSSIFTKDLNPERERLYRLLD